MKFKVGQTVKISTKMQKELKCGKTGTVVENKLEKGNTKPRQLVTVIPDGKDLAYDFYLTDLKSLTK